jgi:hypothetical protein
MYIQVVTFHLKDLPEDAYRPHLEGASSMPAPTFGPFSPWSPASTNPSPFRWRS